MHPSADAERRSLPTALRPTLMEREMRLLISTTHVKGSCRFHSTTTEISPEISLPGLVGPPCCSTRLSGSSLR